MRRCLAAEDAPSRVEHDENTVSWLGLCIFVFASGFIWDKIFNYVNKSCGINKLKIFSYIYLFGIKNWTKKYKIKFKQLPRLGHVQSLEYKRIWSRLKFYQLS